MTDIPSWVLFHIPHDSTHIPEGLRSQFVLSDGELENELLLMTDHHTLDLFAHGVPEAQVIRAPVSRLVVDVERFDDDALEPMAQQGMGVIYDRTHWGTPLRRPLSTLQRTKLLRDWYLPHHAALTLATERALQASGVAVIVDCHSFPSRPLPYEGCQEASRPQICIGTDAFHTPTGLVRTMLRAFENEGYRVGLDSPFGGALVPAQYYKRDLRVVSIMVEVRRDVYLVEETAMRQADFEQISIKIRQTLLKALRSWHAVELGESL